MFDKFHDECGVFADLRPSRSREPRLPGSVRPAASRPGKRRASPRATAAMIHTHHGMGHVADIFTPEVLGRLARRNGHRPHALFHRRRYGAAERAALFRRLQQGTHRGRAQRQHHQRRRAAPRTGTRRLHLPSLQRYRSDSAPGRAVARAHSCRRTARGAAATGRRVFTGLSGRGPHHGRARSAWIPPAGFRPDGIVRRPHLLCFRVRNLRVRSDQRRLSGRCRARRDGDRRDPKA